MSENIKKSTELLPCPFCGSEAMIRSEVTESHNSFRRAFDVMIEWGVGCSDRDCPLSCVELRPLFRRKCDYWITADGILKPVKDGEDGRKYVIDKWNERAK
mgnify:CR=1 FL=1